MIGELWGPQTPWEATGDVGAVGTPDPMGSHLVWVPWGPHGKSSGVGAVGTPWEVIWCGSRGDPVHTMSHTGGQSWCLCDWDPAMEATYDPGAMGTPCTPRTTGSQCCRLHLGHPRHAVQNRRPAPALQGPQRHPKPWQVNTERGTTDNPTGRQL